MKGLSLAQASLVPPGKIIPPNTLALGSPAKVVRELNDNDRADMERVVRDTRKRTIL